MLKHAGSLAQISMLKVIVSFHGDIQKVRNDVVVLWPLGLLNR